MHHNKNKIAEQR